MSRLSLWTQLKWVRLFLKVYEGGLTGRAGGSTDNLTVAPDGTLYAAGEHRRVQKVSTLTQSLSDPQRASTSRPNDSESSRKYQPIVCY